MATAVENSRRTGGKRVILAEPRGFCAGVDRAIEIVERALEIHGAPVYVRKQIVHNEHVVRELEARGARFVDSETEVPDGAVCIFSAHGVSPQVRDNAARRHLTVIDATCPLVAKVHQEARRFARDERTLILVGHADHEEIEGTYGEAPDRTVIVQDADEARRLELPPGTSAAFLTQTTLSVDDTSEIVSILRERFPGLVGPGSEDICYASQNRQNAVKAIAKRADLVLVVGSANSSNTIRMVEVARAAGTRARLLPDADRLDPGWLADVETVGLSAGASAPEVLVEQVIERLDALGFTEVETETTASETVVFKLPSGLERPSRNEDEDAASAALLARATARIEELLSAECSRWGAVDARAALPVEAVAELVAAGGKRLRPMFCVSGYLAAGGTVDDPAGADAVVAAAAGLELLHAFALIHDDVLDNSPTRRGVPTVHVKHTAIHAERGWVGEARRYGEGMAILAGDLAFGYANRLTAGLPGPAMEIWTDLTTEMIIGQQLDVALAAEPAPDPDLARWIAVCKSGRYTIHRPLALGASIAGRSDLLETFEAYGVAAGEAFQLRDDLLDAFGDSAATGKPAGLDVDEHRMNLLLALAATRDAQVGRLVADGLERGGWDPDRLRAALLESGADQEIEERIDRLVASARTALATAPLTDGWRRRLGQMAARVAYRDH
ncbi:4-hydroxy-3-methylbut-2-enyl diphosphate reductase [Actinomadura pelletieri DSM 43383]|uniref:4-hydroxy-3-methylbut-2-enyl diphosphate reductase n=1 Tax=Actinomadura pelletieri DSM 43383 TaxID=1120940 RepID=A0A495QT64_9ACTN|nr:4-hydroxy-3-methylbut-2-enyl diphosphate reductase [Actinomadura pelletieri]RKS76643.1 4-hydroxy-3-methylbut-2-enyl diphosphate reductase [Actinomadura pelletieri DSM 43383]